MTRNADPHVWMLGSDELVFWSDIYASQHSAQRAAYELTAGAGTAPPNGPHLRMRPRRARVSSGPRMRTFMASSMRTARSTSWPLPARTPRER